MYPDGVCRVTANTFSKCIEFADISYQLAQADTKTAIFENLCDLYNYLDASIHVQFSFVNRKTDPKQYAKSFEIKAQGDDFDDIRAEYSGILQDQLVRGNNGLTKRKFLTFTIEADNLKMARARLTRIETDLLDYFKTMGAVAHVLDAKVIWQCVTATKKGKKFCPDSKGIAEETIEQAFIESYRLLCQNNKDVLDEFIARTEETLSDSNASKQLAKVEKDIAALDAKRAKLVDMRLEEIIDKETYEQKYFDLSSQIEQLQKQRESLQESAETESTMKKWIAEFRRTLEENEVLDTFDRYVFESIVEKVIVGGYDEDGNKDPAMLTFIYKTGFKNSLDGTNFKPPRKNSKAAKQNACLCSHTTDEAKSMCSYHSDDTCRDGS